MVTEKSLVKNENDDIVTNNNSRKVSIWSLLQVRMVFDKISNLESRMVHVST